MGHTKAQRRADIRALADMYKVPVKLSVGEIDQCADFGKYDVFTKTFVEYPHLFRVAGQTFADGAVWPVNFFGLAGRQYVTVSSVNYPARFAHPTEIPMLTRNNRVLGRATEPVLFTSDQIWRVLPPSAVLTIEFFQYPAPLADPAVLDAATDTMPEHSEPDIARSGFERMLKMMVDQQAALELTQQEVAHTEKTINFLFQEKFKMLNAEAQLTD